MSTDRLYRLIMALLFIPLSFLFYNFVYFVIGAFSEIRLFYLQIPTLLSYLGLFVGFYLLLLWTRPRGKHRLALVRATFIAMVSGGGLALLLYAIYFGAGLLNDLSPHGIGYPFDGMLVAFLILLSGSAGLVYEKKIAALPLAGAGRETDSIRFAAQIVYSILYVFLALYFVAGLFYMPSYARFDEETSFVLLVVFFLILSFYAPLFLLVPDWDLRKRKIAGFAHLGINVLLAVLALIAFLLFPNALVEGYPALVPLELMGSLYLFPYVMPALLLFNSLGYFLFYAKDPNKAGKLGQWLMNNRLDDWWEKRCRKKKEK